MSKRKAEFEVPEELKDFRNFVYLVWNYLNLPEPTPIQYDISSFLQHGPRRRTICAFRGVGKSFLTSAYAVWQLLLDPQKNILVVSASKARSDDFSTFVQRMIWEMPILAHLKPAESQRTSKIAFDVGPAKAAHAPSGKSVGITGQRTGARADLIISDDAESLNNAATQGQRDKLSELVKEFEAIVKPGGEIVFLGTPQTDAGSLYHILPERGYTTRVWPARYPTARLRKRYGNTLAPKIEEELTENPEIVGEPTDPRRFNAEELAEREASYGRSGFAQQFMLDHFVRPAFDAWLEAAMEVDSFGIPVRQFERFSDAAEFRGRAWNWVDPQKEMTAAITGMKAGILSLQDVAANYGRDVEELLSQIAKDRELMAQFGVKYALEPYAAQQMPVVPEVADDADL